jgi:hypothetical protein
VSAASLTRPRAAGGKDAPVVLDNVDQFRTYSGWRAAFEARRAR